MPSPRSLVYHPKTIFTNAIAVSRSPIHRSPIAVYRSTHPARRFPIPHPPIVERIAGCIFPIPNATAILFPFDFCLFPFYFFLEGMPHISRSPSMTLGLMERESYDRLQPFTSGSSYNYDSGIIMGIIALRFLR